MRPILTKNIKFSEFNNSYFLRAELISFLKKNGLPTFGSKQELFNRVYRFLKGEKITDKNRISNSSDRIISSKPTLETVVDKFYKNTEVNRTFFKSHIGNKFRFSVNFQKWMKLNIGKTFGDAIDAWYIIENRIKKNKGKNEIGAQFEYNQYTRDFFQGTKGYSKNDCLKCWKHKRDKLGSNKFEASDLDTLD